MANVKVKDITGKDAGSAKLEDSVFGVKPNVAVMHEVVRAQRAS